jgi:uncharacterized membrane protein YfcA
MSLGIHVLLASIALLMVWYAWRWVVLERRRARQEGRGRAPLRKGDVAIGFVTFIFDTLGIGAFAPTIAIFKIRRRVSDEQIPGTLNAGHALPSMTEALIFIAVVPVDLQTLVGMIAAAALGALFGVHIVSRLPLRMLQIGMGMALLVAALLFVAKNLHWMPSGGDTLGLYGVTLAVAISVSFILGAIMMVGIGFFAPCMILVSLLGMNPLAAFPIMMGACAFLMPVGGASFIRSGRYDFRTALGLTLGGIPGVLVAAYVVKSLPLIWLRWLVVFVVLYAATLMMASARRARVIDGQVESRYSSPV